jgi:hypothetical protein
MARKRDEHKKEIIMGSATKLFAEKGFHATSIQDIVADSELSVGTIYLYFPNKEEIFNTPLDTGVEIFVEELFKNTNLAGNPEELANMFGNTIIDALQKNISIVTVLTNELSFQEKLQGFYSKITKSIADKYIGDNDEESLYQLLNMSKKEFYAFVTIIVSGIGNAIRFSTGTKPIMKMKDINFVTHEVILRSLISRIDPEKWIKKKK